MVLLGQHHYPDHSFVAGDATVLPFVQNACDILVSGTVLLHLLGYREAIAESRRVARHWCVFHTVPLLQQKPTTMLRKNAYGEPVIEVVLNRAEFLDLIQKEGMAVKTVLETVPHPYLEDTLNTPVQVQTFLCQVLEKSPMKRGDATE
jgi:ubiquinone/menaquinone biosynthesis C-methylase UbiE